MNKEDVADENKRVRAGRKEFKQFCKLNAQSKRTFFELHCFAFCYFSMLWKREIEKQNAVFPVFGAIMGSTKKAVQQVMTDNLRDIDELKSAGHTRLHQLKCSPLR